MKKRNYDSILEKIASENRTTVEEVRRSIEEAIDEAVNNPDPAVRETWKHLPYKGDKPTVEEMLDYTISQVSNR